LFRVSNRTRELHIPVIRCLGKKHVNYLLVLMLLSDNCYYTTVRIAIHKKEKSTAIYFKIFGTKKDLSPPSSKYYAL